MASEYVLSARLRVEGANDFVSDLQRAERAAKDAQEAFKKLDKLDASVNLRGVSDFENDALKAALAAYDLQDALNKLSKDAKPQVSLRGAEQFEADLKNAERGAKNAVEAFKQIDNLNIKIKMIGADAFDTDAKTATENARDLLKVLQNLDKAAVPTLSVKGVDAFVGSLDRVQTAVGEAQAYFETFNSNPLRFDIMGGAVELIADLRSIEAALKDVIQAFDVLEANGVRINFDAAGVDQRLDRLRDSADQAHASLNALENDPVTITTAGVDQLDAALGASRTAAQELGAQLRSIDSTQVGKAADETSRLSSFMSSITTGIAYNTVYAGFQAIGQGARYAFDEIVGMDRAITNAMSIQPQNLPLAKGFEDIARTVSKDLGIPVDQVAEGFYHLASAGFDAETQMQSIGAIAKFAKSGLTDLENATLRGSQALAIFKPAGYDMKTILDEIAQASNVSLGDIDSFSNALTNKAGTAAVTFGQSLEDTLGVLAAFAERGIQGKTAGEQYSIVLRDLAMKANNNKEAFADMGIQVYDSGGKMRSIIDIIANLQEKFAGMSDAQRTAALSGLGFTLRSQTVIMSLLQMGDSAKNFSEDMKNAGGTVDRMVAVQLTSLESILGRLKAFAIDIAITGFDAVMSAGQFLKDTFEPALRALQPAAEAFVRGIGDVATVIAPLIKDAVVLAIQGIAKALEQVGNFASQHQGAVEAFGAALAALAVGHVVTEVANLALTVGGPLLSAMSGAGEAALEMVGNMVAVGQSGSVLGVLESGWKGLGDMIRASPLLAVGLFSAAMVGVAAEVKKASREAQAFADEVARGYNTNTIGGMEGAAAALQQQAAHLRESASNARGVSDFFKTTIDMIPGFDMKNTSIQMYDSAKAAEELAKKMHGAAAEANGVLEALSSWSSGTGIMGPLIANTGEVRAKIEELGKHAGISGGQLQITADQLRRVAANNNVDLSGPWQTWLPVLFDTAIAHETLSKKLQQLGLDTDTANGLADEFTGGLGDMGGGAKTTASQFDELVKAINGLIDGPLSEFDAATAAAESTDKLNAALEKFGLNIDETTKSGREVRDALSDWIGKQRELIEAQSHGDPEKYAQGIGRLRDQFITLATNMGLPIEQAQAMADKLGLIPTEKAVSVVATTKGAQEAKTQLDAVADAPRTATIRAAIAKDDAVADIDRFTNSPRTTTVRAAVAKEDAEAGLNAFTNTPRTATVGTRADTGPAASALDGVAGAPRTATIRAIAAKDDAEWQINNAARDRTATISVYANVYYPPGYVPGLPNADGRVLDFYANGGMAENHVAQIASAGTMRVWAEPETGGEAYIPLAADKRQRSLAIWQETGRRLGVKGFADGGMAVQSAQQLISQQNSNAVTVKIGSGAVQANVSAAVGADPNHLASKIQDAIGPALDEFALNLTTAIRRRG